MKVAPTKWNLYKQDEVLSHYMLDGTQKIKADIEKNLWKIFFRSSKNDFWASRCWLQLVQMASCKVINFLCTLELLTLLSPSLYVYIHYTDQLHGIIYGKAFLRAKKMAKYCITITPLEGALLSESLFFFLLVSNTFPFNHAIRIIHCTCSYTVLN